MIDNSIAEHIIHAAFPYLYGGIRQLLILDAYLDESGTHDTSRVVVVAGWLATSEQWSRFTTEWNAALEEWGIPFFHMTDFANGVGEYSEWTQQEKQDRIIHLISIVNQNVQGSIARIYANDSAVIHWKSGGQQTMNKVGDYSYVMAAQGCLIEAANLSNILYGKTPLRVAYVYETGAQRSGLLLKTFEAINAQPEMREKYRTVTLNFGRKEEFPPLQAADILAYEIYREEELKLISEESGIARERQKRKSLEALEMHPHAWRHRKPEVYL